MKLPVLVAVPAGVATAIFPAVAPAGTVAVILTGVFEYESLRPLMSIQEALAHPETRIHEYGDGGPNVRKAVALAFGDVEAAFGARRQNLAKNSSDS